MHKILFDILVESNTYLCMVIVKYISSGVGPYMYEYSTGVRGRTNELVDV